MANLVIARPNLCRPNPTFATVQVSGGDWLPERPLTNILQSRLNKVARSSDVTTASTQFWVDLGAERRIKVFAFPYIRGLKSDGTISGYLSLTARFRVYGTYEDTSSTLIADSGSVDQHPVIYPLGTLPVTDPSFITGTITDEDAAKSNWKQPVWYFSSDEINGRYIYVTIDAAGSGLQHLDVPPLTVAPGMQPEINMQYGASLGVEDLTLVQEADSGAEFFDERPKRRVWRFTLAHQEEDSAHIQLLDMIRQDGVSTPVFFIFDPDDTEHKERRSFLGRLRSLSPLEFPYFNRNSMAFEISEILE